MEKNGGSLVVLSWLSLCWFFPLAEFFTFLFCLTVVPRRQNLNENDLSGILFNAGSIVSYSLERMALKTFDVALKRAFF